MTMPFRWVAELLLLSAVWGSSFLFMHIASPEINPITLTFIRCVIATIILGGIVYVTEKQSLVQILRYWQVLTLLGITNTALPFSIWGYVTGYLESGTMGVINATAPMFGALIAWFWLKDPLKISTVFGMFLGLAGVGVLLILPQDNLTIEPVSVLMGLFACLNYGVAACLSRNKAAGIRPMTVAAGSQLYAAIVLLPFSIALWPDQMPGNAAISSTLFLGLACSGLAFYLYYKLIAEQGVARALSNMYLIPLFAILWGALFLGEELTLRVLLGGVLVLTGVAFTTGYFSFERKIQEQSL